MSLFLTSAHRHETKGKRGKKRKQRRILACGRKWHACHGIVWGFCRPVIKFGKVWKPIVMVCSPRPNDVQLKKRKKRQKTKYSHTHSPRRAELWLLQKRNMPHKKQFPCTMKNVPITNTVVMSINLFVLSYCSRVVSFSRNPASITCDGTHVSLIRGQHLLLLAFETTPAPRDNWPLKGDSPRVLILVHVSVDQLMPAVSIDSL